MAIEINVGGGGSVIDSVQPFNDDVDLKVDSNGNTWLKTGAIETNTNLYPNAKVNVNYTGTSFSVSAQDASPRGIAWDGTHFWVVGGQNDTVYQYTSAGTYTGTSFSFSAQDNSPAGITWDGTYFWVVGDQNNKVFEYAESVGLGNASTNSDTGLPIYVRVKYKTR